MITTSLLSTLISLSASFLGLALLVQVLQELYKYLTSSKSQSYLMVLVDFLGPHAYQLLRPGTFPELQIRGPFQWLRRRPTGRLQPMDKPDLVAALERTAAPWVQRALGAIRLEASTQRGTPGAPSAALHQFMRDVFAAEPSSPGYFTAQELQQFFTSWGLGEAREKGKQIVNTDALLAAFRQRFVPSAVQTETLFGQLTKNVELAYRRRNLRQTFVFGLLLALLGNLPFDRLYQEASAVPLDQAVQTAEQMRALYAQRAVGDTAPRDFRELYRYADSLRAVLQLPRTPIASRWTLAALTEPFRKNAALYVLGCVITAVLVSFGAPFWNDLAGALLRLNKGPAAPAAGPPPAAQAAS